MVKVKFSFNDTPDKVNEYFCCVGVYNEGEMDDDIFYWFSDLDMIRDHGEFTVHDFIVVDNCENRLLTKLEEYDDYMTSMVSGEGYCLPISLKEFLAKQVHPVGLNDLIFYRKRDLKFFARVKELYLNHAVEVMDATELTNTPVCYAEWEQYEGQGVEDE